MKKFIVVSIGVITALLIMILVPISVNAITYCDGNELKENVTVNDEVITIGNDICNLGCSEWTWSAFGNPGCEESDFTFALFFVALAVILFLILRGVFK